MVRSSSAAGDLVSFQQWYVPLSYDAVSCYSRVASLLGALLCQSNTQQAIIKNDDTYLYPGHHFLEENDATIGLER